MKVIDKRRIVSFFKATDNEVYIDSYIYRILKILPENMGYLPRPSKSRNFKSPYLLKFLRSLWAFLGAYLFFVFQFILLSFNKIFNFKRTVIVKTENLGLGFSEKAMEILTKENGFDLVDTWIVLPWVNISSLSSHNKVFNILELVTIPDLWKSLKLCFLAHFYFKDLHWKFQTYTAFRWFVVRLALEKVNSNFFITEHYDRWAILIDELVFHKKKIESNVSLTLVQHGVLFFEDSFIVPNRIFSVNSIYVYDDASKILFYDFVLAKNLFIFNTPKVYFFKPKISLTEFDSNAYDLTILIVGNSMCLGLHLEIIDFVSSNYKIKCFYKPHPTQRISSVVFNKNWEVIGDKFYFPKVDLLISYPSTLVSEYSSFGINSIIHDFGFDFNKLSSFLDQIAEKINFEINLKKNHGL